MKERCRSHQPAEPWHLLAAVAVAAAAFKVIGPLTDVDLPWHVRLGDEIRSGLFPTAAGQDWSFSVTNSDWATTMWLSEVLMSLLNDAMGWRGFVVARILVLSLTAAALACVLLARFPARAAVPPFVVALVAVAVHLQERPQALSWLFVILFAFWSLRIMADADPPAWWWVVGATALWANLHGMWVLAPSVLALTALARVLNLRTLDSASRRAIALAALAALGGMLTPLGPAGALAPLTVGDAASGVIIEWQRTDLVSWNGLGLATMTLMIAGSLIAVRSRNFGWWAYLVVIAAFGMFAARNATPATLLLAPPAALLMAEALGSKRSTMVSPRESRVIVVAGSLVVTLGILSALAVAALTEPESEALSPFALAKTLEDEAGEVRVLNDYEAAGAVLYEVRSAQVAVDGRTDYYGGDYLRRYVNALVTGEGASELVAELDPTHALLESTSPVTQLLGDQGWEVLQSGGGHTLMRSP